MKLNILASYCFCFCFLACDISKEKSDILNNTPKNVILLIGDGTGLSQVSSAFYFKDTIPNYSRFKHVGLIKTSSSRQDITDSAAGATAFASGVKTYNGAVGVADDSTHVKFQTHFYDAMKQKALENYSKAIDALVICNSLNPTEPAVFHELGINYFNIKQYDSAEYNFQKAIALEGDNFWYKESLYHLYIDQNWFEEAIIALQPLLLRHPDYKQDLVNLYLEAGRYDDALTVLDDLDKAQAIAFSLPPLPSTKKRYPNIIRKVFQLRLL